MIDQQFSSLASGVLKDLTSAADLIRRSWRENRKQTLDYSPEFIQHLVECPGDGPVVAPTYYDNGKMIAFVVGFPRNVRLNKKMRKLLLMTFFTVAPEYKGRGLGRAIWAECLKEAKNAGYDGALHYCVDGDPSNAITVSGARTAGFEARRVFTISFMMRVLHTGAEQPYKGTPASVDVFLNAAASLQAEVPVQRIWSAAEASWQMHRPGAVCVTNANGGALTGYIIHGSDANRRPYFFVEDILWDRLASKERTDMLQEALQSAARGASVAVLPILKYADLSPFAAVGFRRFPRLLHTYLTLWGEVLEGGEMPGLYMDVL